MSKKFIANNQDNIKVSIIVPVFNMEEHIGACLNSLVNQTLKDIEIIVINDASTDNTLKNIQKVSENDNRIKIINYDANKSSSQARKDGVILSSGKYIMFVDGDDSIELTACENLFVQMEAENVDILQFGTNILSAGASEGQIKWFTDFSKPYLDKLVDENILEYCFVKRKFGFNIWNKIYKSELCKSAFAKVKDGYYPKAQDLYAFFIIAYMAKSYLGIEDKYYNYSYGTGITGKTTFAKADFERHCSQTEILLEVINFLIEEKSLAENKNSIIEIINSLVGDNLNTLLRIKNQPLDYNPFEVLASYWIDGKLMTSLIYMLNENKDEFSLYEISLEIIMKLYKNVPNQIREKLLLRIKEVSDIVGLKNIYPDQSKEDLFFQIFVSYVVKSNIPNTIPIVLATDDNYAPYLGVTLQSIIDNSTVESNYEIFIFNASLSSNYISKLEMMSTDNIRVSCVNVSSIIQNQTLYSKSHYSIAMYYRYLIPELLFFYHKVLYLDCDLVLVDKINNLYNIDIGDNILGAIHNPSHIGMSNYLRDTLKFDKRKYFNSGVLLINTEKFISSSVKQRCYDILKQKRDLACPDQDALNLACKNRVYEIDQKWNFQWHHAITLNPTNFTKLSIDEQENYYEAMNSFSLIHFTSNIKPWNTPSAKFSNLFWNYAKRTLFYEEIIYKNTKFETVASKPQNQNTSQGKTTEDIYLKAIGLCRDVINSNNTHLAIDMVKMLKGYLKNKSLLSKFFFTWRYEGLVQAITKTSRYLKRILNKKG